MRVVRLLSIAMMVCVACSSESTSAPDAPAAPSPSGTIPPPASTDSPPGTMPPPAASTGTTVRVHYAGRPGALTLRGSLAPLSWDTSAKLTQDATDKTLYVWSDASLKERLELKPMLDDAWSKGPNFVVDPGKTVDVYPRFVVTKGTVTKAYPSFASQKLPSTRGLWVYLPPTYVENATSRFGVLYMHDAQNLFDPALAYGGNEWKVDETLDAGADDGSIRETIVVGVENDPQRIDELTPVPDPDYGGGKGDQYLSMIIDEVKPLVDKDLRTLSGRTDTGIMGSSLGGLISVHAAIEHADVFGLVGAMSPSTWWNDRWVIGRVPRLSQENARPTRLYVDSGDSGPSNDDVVNTKDLADAFVTQGFSEGKDLHYTVAKGAQHNETYWAARLPAALHFLLGSAR